VAESRIEADNPAAAEAFRARIRHWIEVIRQHPQAGHRHPKRGEIRRLVESPIIIADALATRHPGNAETLSEELLALFDAPEERKNYLELQGVIANLRLRERAELERSFEETIQRGAVR
jgi:hypothetical protein